jgi:hypothetical protein
MTRVLIVLALGLPLACCAEYQAERAAEASVADDARCGSYGARPGSGAYAQCRMNLDNQRETNRRAAVGAFLETQRQNNAQQAPVYQMPTNRQTNCTSVINGQIVSTTCN